MRMILLLLLSLIPALIAGADETAVSKPPLILTHYMPWFSAPPQSGWGWHWTMNHFDPENVVDGQREIASKYYPLIGPYDSSDPHVLEYHLLLMKLAGIDGVIVDWYGLTDYRDYAILHRNTQKLIEQVERLKMKYAICYEDQTITALVDAGRIQKTEKVSHARKELAWMANEWFSKDSYVTIEHDGNRTPLLLSFGHNGLTNEEWTTCLKGFTAAYFSEHNKRQAAIGAFDWPIPQSGLEHTRRFASTNSQPMLPVAYPRFVDIYREAEINDGYPEIPDSDGDTLRTTLNLALKAKPQVIQIATWNDWGEGTQIEPSQEMQHRDLELLQKTLRSNLRNKNHLEHRNLRLPVQILRHRRTASTPSHKLNHVVELIVNGKVEQARESLQTFATEDLLDAGTK